MTTPRATQLADAFMTYIAAGGRVQALIDPATGRTRYCVSDDGVVIRITERGDAAGE